jgi:hypothetical protein
MKKKFLTAILAVSCVGMSFGSALAADVVCSTVSIYRIGMNNGSIILTAKNETGALCGDWAAGTTRQFVVNPAVEPDSTYATILTAFSLQKKLSIKTADPGSQGSFLITVGIIP